MSAIIIAVCVACLLILTVAAILYVRLHGYVTGIDEEEEDIVMNEHVVKEVQEEELDWDDSDMIITSNPMEVYFDILASYATLLYICFFCMSIIL